MRLCKRAVAIAVGLFAFPNIAAKAATLTFANAQDTSAEADVHGAINGTSVDQNSVTQAGPVVTFTGDVSASNVGGTESNAITNVLTVTPTSISGDGSTDASFAANDPNTEDVASAQSLFGDNFTLDETATIQVQVIWDKLLTTDEFQAVLSYDAGNYLSGIDATADSGDQTVDVTLSQGQYYFYFDLSSSAGAASIFSASNPAVLNHADYSAQISIVPEPSSLGLLGLCALPLLHRRGKRLAGQSN